MRDLGRRGRRYGLVPEMNWTAGLIALSLVPAVAAGCGGKVDANDVGTDSASAEQAVTGADCGYSVTAHVTRASWKGFRVKVTVKSTNGRRLDPAGLTVLVKAGSAKLASVGHGTFRATENGYLLSSVSQHERLEDILLDEPNPIEEAEVLRGRAYRFHLKFEGMYSRLSTTIMSSGGVKCDQAAPTLALATSGDLFTSKGTLTLNATASDNVAVAKVVFAQDGTEIGTVRAAPYKLKVPVSSAINGRHRYTATAYDLAGNSASETKRALVAIGNKFFGTEAGNVDDFAGLLAHFNQVTPGNAGKWGSVEPVRDQMNWTDLDTAYNFAKTNHIPFKLHTLVWGQQQPAWLANLTPAEQLAEIEQWMTALAERYPDVQLVDVVNEPLHAPPSYAAALGGAGATGWDWVIKAFEMARAHFPNSELLLNDYSILSMASATQDYLGIVKLLSDRGLVDGIGEQGHFYERAPEMSVLTTNFNALVATGLPIYISELDLNFADDARQAKRMSELFPLFWSTPSVLGITHWGYRQGAMWQPNAYLVKTDGTARPALTFVECYKAGGTNCPVPTYVPQPRTGGTLEAEEYDSAHGLLPAGNVVAYAGDGAWLGFDQVVFEDNWNTLSVAYALGSTTPISLSIHLGSLDNAPVATVPLAPTGDWSTTKTVSVPWAPMNTKQDVFVRFHGGGANVDKFQFAAPSGTGPNVIKDSDFELGTTGNWFSWGPGTIANTTARATSGTHSLAMTGRSGNSPLAQDVTSSVLPGKTYKFSLFATAGGASASPAYVTTGIQCAGGETTYGRIGDWGNTKTLTDGTWVEFAGDLVIPDCSLAKVQFWLEGPSDVDLYVDHVSVRQGLAANIIPNGTFESGTSGWYTWGGATAAASTSRAHGGAQSLVIDGRTGNSPAATDITSLVKAGNNYPFSLWTSIHAADGSSGSVNVTQATTCQNADGTNGSTSYNWIAGPITLSGGADWAWTQLSGTIAIPNCTIAQVQLFVEGAATADQLFIDDVQIIDNSGQAISNLITDGTFESGIGAWGGWGYTTLSVVTTRSHGGASSLLGAGMQSSGAVARDIKALVAPGKKYQASAWVSVNNANADTLPVKWQTVQRCNGDSSDSYPWLAGTTVANGQWAQVAGVVDLSACTSIENLLLFAGADAGDIYLDDVVLTPVP